MKKLLFLSLLTLSIAFYAQNKVGFTYDNVGNRSKRAIIISSRSAKFELPISYEESFTKEKLLIYPNPTKGILFIQIENFTEDTSGNIEIFSMSGALVYTGKIISDNFSINIDDKPSGVYIMSINLNGENSSRKIIKED